MARKLNKSIKVDYKRRIERELQKQRSWFKKLCQGKVKRDAGMESAFGDLGKLLLDRISLLEGLLE